MRAKEAMTRDKMYEAAFRYKKAKLWTMLWDSEVFAVKLKSGEIGYVSIMGRNGEHNALGLYIGKEGFESYQLLASMAWTLDSSFRTRETLLRQRCLQTALESKEYLLPEEVSEVRAYAKENGIRLSGKYAFPQFVKYEPGYHPWKVKTQADMNALFEAMEAAILLADMLRGKLPSELGIVPVDADTETVPLFEVSGGKLLSAGTAPLPGLPEEKYTYTQAENQIAIATVKKLPKRGVWESELIQLPEPVQNDPEETPYYPLFLMAVESGSHFVLPVPLTDVGLTNPQTILQAFANACKVASYCAKEIRCRDERTYALLKDFCEKVGVKIRIYEGELPALDDAQESLWEHMSDESGFDEEDSSEENMIEDMIMMLGSMSMKEIRMMPQPLVAQLRLLLAQGAFPPDFAKELKKKLTGL